MPQNTAWHNDIPGSLQLALLRLCQLALARGRLGVHSRSSKSPYCSPRYLENSDLSFCDPGGTDRRMKDPKPEIVAHPNEVTTVALAFEIIVPVVVVHF